MCPLYQFMKLLNIKNVIYSNSEGTLTKCRVKDYTTSHVSQGNRFWIGEWYRERT